MSRLKAVQRGTNAELIAAAQALYPMNGQVLDLTPGDELGFWKEFRPDDLRLRLLGQADWSTGRRSTDFRRTAFPDRYFDHVVFDPPYVTKGGHATSTIGEMNKRYGMLHVEKDPPTQWSYQILPGVVEAARILVDEGLLWFKCMDFVTSGRNFYAAQEHAVPMLRMCGFDVIDRFILDGEPGPQPLTDKCKGCAGSGHTDVFDGARYEPCPECDGTGSIPRRQLHASNAHSFLFIARKIRTQRRTKT